MTHKKALERILDQYVGIDPRDISTLETNVMNFACMALGVEMRQNQYGEFQKSTPLKIHRVK
jgi:hypothetical protein